MHLATRRRAAAAIVSALALLAVACSSGKSTEPPPVDDRHGGTLRLAVVASSVTTISGTAIDPTTVGPTDQDAMVLVDLTSDGLTSVDPTTQLPVPALASSWSADAAGTSWTFTLRDDATFSDGSPVTAADVASALERVASRAGLSLAGARLDVIAGYADFVGRSSPHLSGLVAKDDHTLVVTTSAPDVEVPLLLGSPLYGVVKVTSTSADSTSTSAANGGTDGAAATPEITGSGPFMITSGNDPIITMPRSPGSTAQLEEVDAERFADSIAALSAVDTGKADWASVPPARQPQVAASPPSGIASGAFHLQTSPLGAEVFFGMNLTSPTFANPKFRQAIILAVDRSALVAASIPGLTANSAVVPAGVPGAVPDACREQCVYDTATAKAVLAQNFPDGAIPTVQIDTDDDPGSMKVASLVQLYLAAVGIPVELKALPIADYQRFVTTGQQQLFLTGWVGLAPSGAAYLDPLFRSGSLDNSTSFSSPDIDARLAQALANPDDATRTSQYVGIEHSVLGEFPVLPLGSYSATVAVSSGVQEYQPRIDGTFVAEGVWVGQGTTASTG